MDRWKHDKTNGTVRSRIQKFQTFILQRAESNNGNKKQV